EKRSKATFYGYIHNRSIPFHKRSKKLVFLKSEIDDWLKAGRRKTRSEIESEAGQNLNIRRAAK
ncbi:helix-turn-helix domain-containing protein, partial [Bacteroidota bacterium]